MRILWAAIAGADFMMTKLPPEQPNLGDPLLYGLMLFAALMCLTEKT